MGVYGGTGDEQEGGDLAQTEVVGIEEGGMCGDLVLTSRVRLCSISHYKFLY